MTTLVKLAMVLEIPLDDLFEGIEWVPEPSRPPEPRPTGRFRVTGKKRTVLENGPLDRGGKFEVGT